MKKKKTIEWKWISRSFYDGHYLNIPEGPTLDYKLTVFSDYMNFSPPSSIHLMPGTPILEVDDEDNDNYGNDDHDDEHDHNFDGDVSSNISPRISISHHIDSAATNAGTNAATNAGTAAASTFTSLVRNNGGGEVNTSSIAPSTNNSIQQKKQAKKSSKTAIETFPSPNDISPRNVYNSDIITSKSAPSLFPLSPSSAQTTFTVSSEISENEKRKKKRVLTAQDIKEAAYESNNIIDFKKLGLRLTEYLIAFLNSNGGCLIFGVRDDSKVCGMRLTEKQQDKIKLTLDNCIRNFQITPTPKSDRDYKFEFVSCVNDPGKCLLILEVQPSTQFHYATIHSNLKSWERLNASNMSLNDRPAIFVKRLKELRDTLHDKDDEDLPNGYLTLVFPDTRMLVSEKVLLSQCGSHNKPIYRFDLWCELDSNGRFIVERPSKYFKFIYQYLQIGAVSMKKPEYPIFLLETYFYGVNINPNNAIEQEPGYILILSEEKHHLYISHIQANEKGALNIQQSLQSSWSSSLSPPLSPPLPPPPAPPLPHVTSPVVVPSSPLPSSFTPLHTSQNNNHT